MEEKSKKTVLRFLIDEGLLTKKQAEQILINEDVYHARLLKSKGSVMRRGKRIRHDVSIMDIIESLKFKIPGSDDRYITEELITEVIAKHLRLPFIKIDPLKLDLDTVTKIISRPYAIRHHIVPIKLSDNTLTIATSNPFEQEGIEGIKQTTGYGVELVVSPKSDIEKIITEFYGFKYSVKAAHAEITSQIDISNLEQYFKLKSISELDATDQHIINAVEYLLHYAYSQRASDIHIEPKREHSLVRFRIDGVLHDIHKLPKTVHPPFISRIKTMARMDIAEKRRPQDGRIKTEQEGKMIELRVSTLPVAFGEKVVVRIFDPAVLMQDIEKLGFLDRELSLFKSFISNPHGLILVTGPTGSGKTTTLYSALRVLSTPDVNITTIEDPIEMIYEEFNQTAVHPQIGITFAASLRTILRQDPDIIMVGEIRDFETADNAIQSALTGHLVLSTLHTNDAPSSIARLIDLGVQPFLINSTLIGIIAQRLVRKVCRNCAEPYYLTEDESRMLGIEYEKVKDTQLLTGGGCRECRGTGYMGRIGIFEVMEINEKMRAAIEKKLTPEKIGEIARQDGFTTLRECAIQKLLAGVTTFDEVLKVTGIFE